MYIILFKKLKIIVSLTILQNSTKCVTFAYFTLPVKSQFFPLSFLLKTYHLQERRLSITQLMYTYLINVYIFKTKHFMEELNSYSLILIWLIWYSIIHIYYSLSLIYLIQTFWQTFNLDFFENGASWKKILFSFHWLVFVCQLYHIFKSTLNLILS